MKKILLFLTLLYFVPSICFGALPAGLVWEYRATGGAANNGGCYDLANDGGTDYSDQDAAQLSLTDLTTAGIGNTTLTSVTGGFTAAMVDNCIQIRSGTNVTAGFYEITVHTDTNTVTLDRAPDDGVGGISGGSGDVGGALDIIIDAHAEVYVTGNKIYIKDDGTMTLTDSPNTANDGTEAAPIEYEGYNTTRGDAPVGTNRPLVDVGANIWAGDNNWYWSHLRATGTGSAVISVDDNPRILNVQSFNTSGSANRDALNVRNQSYVIHSELKSTACDAIEVTQGGLRFISNYIHDSDDGLVAGIFEDFKVINNIFDTITNEAMEFSTGDKHNIINNTIYNAGIGILYTDSDRAIVLNNLIDNCTTGISTTTEQAASSLIDFNVYSNNTTDVTNITKGANAVTSDITLTDPANGDFTLPDSSPAEGVAMQVDSNRGVTGDYNWNIGADQTDTQAGGGGASNCTFVQ